MLSGINQGRVIGQTQFKTRIRRLDKETLIINKQQFNLELQNSFSLLDLSTEDVQQQFSNIENCIQIASSKLKRTSSKLKKLSPETVKLIEERFILAKDITDPQYKHKNREVKRNIRKDIRIYNENTVQIALERNRSLKIAKQGISKGKSWITSIKDNTGKKHQSRDKCNSLSKFKRYRKY
ncbi:Endonuclease-reverse transcriptase [Operophtera brumata]|uniref:Endonuclease-reverse transcriptase n=1 Tax=Operophtera brumata TaxID=104452 RepID=A0A0L7LRR7_OPEBR|nr:Endonuclease-reverse transcriptase [Operophtera brumata]